MFGKNDSKIDKIDTLIGKNTSLEGKVEAQGTIRLDGKLKGDLIVEGSAIIGESAKVVGNINCSNIFISGVVEGNIVCKDQLRLTNTAKLFGDVEVRNFIVDENAFFQGNCKMENTLKDKKEVSKNKQEKGA